MDSESKLLLSRAEQVRCQIIINFTVHIVTVFSAQISGAARVARWEEVGGWALELEGGKITGNFSTRLLLRTCFVWLLC